METATIKAALKAAGFNCRQVTVKHRPCGYDDAWTVTIRDESVSQLQIEQLLAPFEVIDRDARGEICGGCNCFIHVQKDDFKADEDLAKAVSEALATLEKDGQNATVNGWIIFKEGSKFLCHNSAMQKTDYSVGRFSVFNWSGAAGTIAQKMKEKELDSNYLQNKLA